MALLDFLIGRKNLDRMQEAGEDFAKAQYDPSQVNPMLARARTLSTEGIDDDSIRKGIVDQVYTQSPTFTGNVSQGRQLALASQLDQARASALGQAETQIGMAESQAKQKGRDMEAQALSTREELLAKRAASIAETRMMVEAEAGARKGKLVGSLIGLGSAALMGGGGKDILKTFLGKSAAQGTDKYYDLMTPADTGVTYTG